MSPTEVEPPLLKFSKQPCEYSPSLSYRSCTAAFPTQNCMVTPTPTGHHKPIAIQSLDLLFFMVKVLYPGVPRSNQLLRSQAPRPNTSPSRTSQRNSSGITNFIPNYRHSLISNLTNQYHSTATIKAQLFFQRMQPSICIQSILIPNSTLFEKLSTPTFFQSLIVLPII